MSSRAALCLAAVAALAGCAAGPDYRTPAVQVPQSYVSGAPLPRTVAAGGTEQQLVRDAHADLANWWQRFETPQLAALVERAFAGNFDLRSAQARLDEARHLLDAAHGGRWPRVAATASATRQRGGAAGAGASAGTPGGDTVFEVVTAAGTVAYDVDVAGGVSRRIEAAAAEADRAAYALRAAALALAGNIVASAIDGARLAAQVEARRGLIDAQRRRLGLIEAQVDAGAVARAELVTARAELAATEAPLPVLQQARAAAMHRLALLLGVPPAEFEPPAFRLDALKLPQRLPLRLPAELLRQRPDIRAAEAALRSASARIGVATADLYPRLTLDASFGHAVVDAGGATLSGPLWSLGASLLAPIFEGGRLRAEREAAVAAYDAALAGYRGTVLAAFTEVADVLRAIENDAQALAAQEAALAAARESLELAEIRRDAGVVGVLEVLIAQQQVQQAVIGAVDARAARLADTARLFAALGGAALPEEPAR